MLFIYAKGKERVIFISILAYLKVQVLLLSTYNVYQEKMLTEKFLEDLNPTFFKYCHFINLLNFFSFFLFSFDIFSLPPSLSPSVFFKKIYLFIYLFLAAPELCCCARALSKSCGEQGLLSSCGAQASHCSGLSCGAQARGRSGFSGCGALA